MRRRSNAILFLIVAALLGSVAWLVSHFWPWSLLLLLLIVLVIAVTVWAKKRRPREAKRGGQDEPHDAHDPHATPAQSREPKRGFWKLLWNVVAVTAFVWVSICVGLFLFNGGRALVNWSNRPRGRVVVSSTANYAPPTALVPAGPIPHMFGADGCVETQLKGNWSMDSIPLKQAVNVFNERGRLVLEMGAEDRGASLPAGRYRICRAPGSDALGITISN